MWIPALFLQYYLLGFLSLVMTSLSPLDDYVDSDGTHEGKLPKDLPKDKVEAMLYADEEPMETDSNATSHRRQHSPPPPAPPPPPHAGCARTEIFSLTATAAAVGDSNRRPANVYAVYLTPQITVSRYQSSCCEHTTI
jgi:hypothetical protein